MYRYGLLHTRGAGTTAELVVLGHSWLRHHPRCPQLRLARISFGRLHRWQYLYLLAGALTALFGAFCFAFPDSAASARFLTVVQRAVAVEWLRKGQAGMRCQKVKGYQERQSILDIRIWILFAMEMVIYGLDPSWLWASDCHDVWVR